jgi:phosphoglycerol transferase MdoB-like AlkP superfamily enzyme
LKKIFTHFLRIIIFYLLLFAVARLAFFIVNHSTDPHSASAIYSAYFYGIRMDLSVISYIFLPSFLITLAFLFYPSEGLRRAEYIYHVMVLILFCLLLPGNIFLYKYWNTLISFRSISYLKDFSQIFSSFSFLESTLTVILLIAFIILSVVVFTKFFFSFLQPVFTPWLFRISGFLLMLALLVVLMRGGMQKLPMNESLVSFSNDDFINQATINPAWHLANDIYRAGIFQGNPFAVYPDSIAKKNVEELFSCSPDSFPHILRVKKPDIVFLILESFTADIVGAMGGEKGITPNLDLLIHDGLFFDSIYASGTRTDQGIVSLLNGWPATPYYSIMRSTEKVVKLPSLPLVFLQKGYSTSFYYGGESNFSNLNVYCIRQKFEKIIDEKEFPSSIPRGGWGVQDEFVLKHQLENLSHEKEPFFSVVMTLSNHEPFDVPGQARFPGSSNADRFRNSSAYTDAVLGEYFSKAKQQPWYRNTLFIIAADHGHSLPKGRNIYYPESHKIPLLFYGDVIKPEFRGAIVTKMGGHHDVANTLMNQIDPSSAKQFSWSKNLLNPTVKPFAYYQIDYLAGWIDSRYWYGYSYNRNKFIARSYNMSEQHLDSMKMYGQSFVQRLYDAYKGY